ncbi:hypothetical protein [Flavobacterium sp.]|uniref:hypothetical protein n=1 Tax=Flavobacterium sp. TaxID=239 RepID=UPI0038FCA130
MKFSEIKYCNRDIVNLIKFNTAILTNEDEKDLYIELNIHKNYVEAKVRKIDKQDLLIDNENLVN